MKLKKFDLEHEHRGWWFRSAYSGYSNDLGFAYYDGDVYSDIAYNNALQLCIII